MTGRLDYVGFETHRPDYATYVRALELHPDRPVFMEDRFRIRDSRYAEKDYDEELTRRGLWHSSMAGTERSLPQFWVDRQPWNLSRLP